MKKPFRMKRGMLQTILTAALLAAVSCLSAACTGQQEEVAESSRQESVPVEVGDRQEVVLWSYYETKKQKEGLDRLVEGFNKSQKEYAARWEYQGPSSEFKKLLSIGVAEEKLPDLVLIDNPDMRKYVEFGIFEDITDEVEQQYDVDAFYPDVISSVRYDGRYYGLPFCCNNVGLVYNKEMFREAGVRPPEDWEQFVEAAKIMTTEERYGFAMSAIVEEQSSFQLVPWLLSAGDAMQHLGGTGTMRALTMLRDLVEQGYMPKDCINWSQVDVARQFAAGKCAMMENGPWALPLVEEAGIDYGVVKLPVDQKRVVVTGGENFGVVKGKNVAGALALIAYCYQDDVMLELNKQMYSLPPIPSLAVKLQEENPAYRVFAEQMEHCISRSSYPYWPQITGVLSEALYGTVTGEMTPEEAAGLIRDRMPQG